MNFPNSWSFLLQLPKFSASQTLGTGTFTKWDLFSHLQGAEPFLRDWGHYHRDPLLYSQPSWFSTCFLFFLVFLTPSLMWAGSCHFFLVIIAASYHSSCAYSSGVLAMVGWGLGNRLGLWPMRLFIFHSSTLLVECSLGVRLSTGDWQRAWTTNPMWILPCALGELFGQWWKVIESWKWWCHRKVQAKHAGH